MEIKKGMLFDFKNVKYYVHDTINYNNSNYLIAVEYDNPRDIEVFAYKVNDEKFMVKVENDFSTIKTILFSSLKKEVA